jgi:hypothetical protein
MTAELEFTLWIVADIATVAFIFVWLALES